MYNRIGRFCPTKKGEKDQLGSVKKYTGVKTGNPRKPPNWVKMCNTVGKVGENVQ